MSDDSIELYMDSVSDGSSYIESLIKSRIMLDTLKNINPDMKAKLEVVIMAELDLALMGAEKAKSEILKKIVKDNKLVPIK